MGDKRSKLQKTLLIVLPLVVVFFSIIYIYQTTQKGILIDDSFLKQHTQGNVKVYTGKVQNENAKITVEKKNDNTSLISINISNKYNKEYQVKFENTDQYNFNKKIVVYEKGNEIFKGFYSKDDMFLIDDNGKPYMNNFIRISAVNGTYNWNDFDIGLKKIADIVYGNTVHKGNWYILSVATLFLILTLIDIAFPLLFFKLKYVFDVKDPEPSDFYLASQRFSWIALPIVYIIVYIIGLIKIA